MSKAFSISNFEAAFYYLLYQNSWMDIANFTRKMLYNGIVVLVKLENSRISEVLDLSHDRKVLYTSKKQEVTA